MADSDPSEKPELAGRPISEFPDARFPSVFADTVSSISAGPGIVKFYLARFDPNMWGKGGATANPFAQVVMQVPGFVQTALLFQNYAKSLIAQNAISQEMVDQLAAGLTTTASENKQ
jgi:hypothetical protein